MNTTEYSVCHDCVIYLANNEIVNEDLTHEVMQGFVQRITKGKGHFSVNSVVTESDNFSWNPCELCLSRLGGSRHTVTLFKGD